LANALDACAAAPPEPTLEVIERFRAEYSVEACARKHRALYEELLREHAK
jgi:hypothetical protein